MRRRLWIACALAVGLIAAGCGDDDDDGGAAPSGSATTTTETPKAGGTVTIAVFAQSRGLDPTVALGTGVTGGIEDVALYDTLITWDPTTGNYEPRVAQSLEHNADFTVWTLKLRSGVKFSDGTDYNAEAVVFNLKRHIEKRSQSAALVAPIKTFETPDPLTVVMTLSAPWSAFPFTLASAPGMIVSPTAIAKLGDSLPTNPVGAGAGPFVFDSFKPDEAIVLKKNPNYWGGDVYLDEVRFILVGGQDATYEALKANTAQLAYIRDPRFVAQAQADGNVAFESVYSAGDTMVMNNGVPVPCTGGQPAPLCTGQADGALVPTKSPFSDKRLRQAAAAAIDLDQLDQRLNQGEANYDSALLSPNSRWYAGTAGPKYDLETAKRLVSEVKAEGNWDGTVRVRCSKERSDWGIAVQTMLQAAGFNVQLTQDQDTQATITGVIVNKDYDAACWGTSISDAEPWFAINRDFNSTLTGFAGNWVGYSNPQVDAALKDAQAAKTDDAKKAALDVVSKAYAVDVPFLVIGATNDLIAARENVRGVTGTAGTNVYLDKVWLQ